MSRGHDTDHSPVRQRSTGASPKLPVVGQPDAPPERADAARNRKRVLDAAKKLFDERGVAAVTLDDVVAAAGVGKGTLFRRFGDKAGLGAALLGAREEDLARSLQDGPPPLGPGAPAVVSRNSQCCRQNWCDPVRSRAPGLDVWLIATSSVLSAT